MIDLPGIRDAVATMVVDGVRKFAVEQSDVEVSTVGIFAQPYAALFTVSFDTRQHSDSHVAEFERMGPAWYGEDAHGRYCYCCADFAFPDFAGVELADRLPDFYECDPNLEFVELDGTITRFNMEDEGDEAINQVLFRFLKAILTSIDCFRELHRSVPFRIGIQLYDSLCLEYWIPEQ